MKMKQIFGVKTLAVAIGLVLSSTAIQAETFTEALTGGTPSVDARLRYESVDQDNAAQDAEAMTLRTRLGYTTGNFNGFSAMAEFVDVTVIGDDDYSLPATPDPKPYSVIADPEGTEVNRVSISYGGFADTTATFGRQRIILDNARFVGNVGWRQNEQTYDAFLVKNTSLSDTTLTYAYLSEVNTITFGETDIEGHLVNASYAGLPIGTITGYGYFLEFPAAPTTSSKTLGVRLSGSQPMGDVTGLYTLEYASQSDYKNGSSLIDADYYLIELGAKFSGVTAKLGYEVLGEDSFSGFETPLATKHAFNGWTDQFLGTPTTGIQDLYVLATTDVAGVKLLGVYHDYEADTGGADYGDEWGLLASKKFGKHYSAGIKYSSYDADTFGVDTDKLWLWGGLTF